MRKSGRKFLGIILAAVIAAVSAVPVQSIAAEREKSAEYGTHAKASLAEKETEKRKASAEDTVTEMRNLQKQNQETEAGDSAKRPVVEEMEGKTFMLPENSEDEMIPRTDSYDINPPVIQSFEFGEDGEALTVKDTLHFTVSAYDADGEIDEIYVYVSCRDPQGTGASVRLEKSGEGNLYTGALSCSELKGKNFYISGVRAEDKADNYTDWDVWDENGQYRYQFTLDAEVNVDENVVVSNFRMQVSASQADGKLRAGDTVTYTADVTCKDETISQIQLYLYTNTEGYYGSQSVSADYSADTRSLTGVYTVTEETYPGEWGLEQVYVYVEAGKSYNFYPTQTESDANLRFTVVQENFDTEKPVIEDISIDKNGEIVKAGDVITITVKVKEEHPLEHASAWFYPQVEQVSASAYVDLEFYASTGEYIGVINVTEDMYPCEWALTSLSVCDEVGHITNISEFREDVYDTYPWYFNVKSGNTFREDMKNVTFAFYGLARQEDGSFQPDSLMFSQTVENVGRRASLKELGVSFPQSMEGLTAAWTYGWRGLEADENTRLLFNSSTDMMLAFYASYEKGCANVRLTYMTEDSGIKEICIPVIADKETAYGNILELLELPEDARTEDFAGLQLTYNDDYHNETTRIGDCAYLYAEAVYKNCQAAWNTRYVGEDGQEVSQVISKSYLEGTRISDALAELEAPKTGNGLEFAGWVLTDSVSEDTFSQSVTSLNVVAVYQGKTTADASYTYRGEDGKITCGSKMMLLNGENLTDTEIQGEASEAFKAAGHLSGLILSEWTCALEVNQERYKKVQFQAVYANCVVVLKYPDDTCQYIVADKNSEFLLPAENEKYKEIRWEGCTIGEKIVITGDREFLVAEYKLQDGAADAPAGEKLPEEEIAKILTEIEDASAGTSIKIDMKKATVVPKEILAAIQGKQVDIVLDMGAYSWSIGGTEVLADELKDIDLEVKIGTNAVPAGLVASLAEGKPVTQLSLTHNGEFGFRADLTLNLGSENSGGTGNLYYYDSSGKLIFRNAGQIGADGTASLSFSHASDYVIVIDSGKGEPEEKEEEEKEDKEVSKAENPEEDQEKNANKKQNERKISDQETANVRKNKNYITKDSGETTKDDSNQNQRKSPKTGE